jgi:NAD(P)-dependent dehydrogenase (short-subunit alcohol dehydrogenase family)
MTDPDTRPADTFLRLSASSRLVVTGGGSGIGRATVELAARQGLPVSAWDLDGEAAGLVAEELGAEGLQVHALEVDITDGRQVRDAFARTTDEIGPVDLLFNNAGPAQHSDLSFGAGVAASLGGVGTMTEAWLETEGCEGGSVVATASIAGNVLGVGVKSWYPAAKAGIGGYTRWLSVNRPRGIRANAVLPGSTITPRNEANLTSEAGRERTSRNPLGRAGRSAEIASAALFLLSPAAAYINGVLLVVDGGMSNVM